MENKSYFALFNSITEALQELELIRLRLQLAQFMAEELYIQEPEEE